MKNDSIQRKKILFLITKANFGGAQRYVYDLVTSLPEKSFEVIVACGRGKALKAKLKEKNIPTLSIETLDRNINILNDLKTIRKLSTIIKKEKPDIIHINSSKIGGLGALVGRYHKIPNIVFTGHGWAFNENRNIFSKIVIFILHALTILLSHHTIAVSEETKKQIADLIPFSFIKNKIYVIHNGITPYTCAEKETARAHITSLYQNNALQKESVWIGVVGELHHIKGHSYLIDAISELVSDDVFENIQLVILGEGEERNRLETQIKRYGLSKHVFLVGNIDQAALYMNAFDIFIFPSLSEAFPYTILEAGNAGLPVVASRVGGIPEVITHKENGLLVKPKDISGLKHSLLTLLHSPDLRKSYGEELKKKVSSLFSHHSMVEKTIGIYNKEYEC